MQPLFVTSGDMQADRRYEFACQFWKRGDLEAAADILRQTLDLAPGFASAWFSLGEIRDALGDRNGAVAAFRRARDCDPADAHGASLHLMRLGAEPVGAMPPAYVRALFDQYAPEFNSALLNVLNYRGPRILRDAVFAALKQIGREPSFSRAIDLGCGTGLAARGFDRYVGEMIGCDISAGMIEQARRSGLFNRLETGDMESMLREEAAASAELIFSADAMVYLGDLSPLFRQVARVLMPGGLLAFTVETHEGDGVILGEGLRYAHAAGWIGEALAREGLNVLSLTDVSTRDESGEPVPGLVVVAQSTKR